MNDAINRVSLAIASAFGRVIMSEKKSEQNPVSESICRIHPHIPTTITASSPIVVKKRKMRKWPENNSVVPYNDIVKHIKTIIDDGYRLIRNTKKEFDYVGYNIGKTESDANNYLIPKIRFTESGLAREKKQYNRNLIDVALNVLFLLGIEQGRRVEQKNRASMEDLTSTIEEFKRSNKELRLRVDELEAYIKIKQEDPYATDEAITNGIKEIVSSKRKARIEAIKGDIIKNKSHFIAEVSQVERLKFDDLVALAKKEQCSITQWKEFLEAKGWTFEEWQEKCARKFVNINFKDQS